MDEEKIEKLKNLLEIANSDFVSSSDFATIIDVILDGLTAFREDLNKKVENADNEFTKKVDDLIETCKESLKKVEEVSKGNVSDFRKELDAEVEKLRKEIRDIELTPGEPGEDAEFTEEIKEEIADKILIELRKEYTPELKKQIKEAVDEAVKNIKPTTTFINNGGVGAPFEIPIKAGLNVTVTKDVSGAYVISASGGTSTTQVRNEVVAGSGTAWNLAHAPSGGVAVYGGGSRLYPTDDYSIVGGAITTVNAYSAGQLLADYEY